MTCEQPQQSFCEVRKNDNYGMLMLLLAGEINKYQIEVCGIASKSQGEVGSFILTRFCATVVELWNFQFSGKYSFALRTTI